MTSSEISSSSPSSLLHLPFSLSLCVIDADAHTCMFARTRTYTSTHACAHVHTHTRAQTRAHAQTNTDTRAHTRTCARVHTHVRTQARTHAHTHTHTHTHTCPHHNTQDIFARAYRSVDSRSHRQHATPASELLLPLLSLLEAPRW